ncbi:hypothetical protein BRC87_00465 [Halobacteriales archaeon QS_4_66_20]|nr:MAG: hypothetical protein BRC87_00465 [Halobacteriales archaeon QS_4_66_20]
MWGRVLGIIGDDTSTFLVVFEQGTRFDHAKDRTIPHFLNAENGPGSLFAVRGIRSVLSRIAVAVDRFDGCGFDNS